MSGSVITGSYGERLGGSPDPDNQYITSGTLYMNVMTNDGVINWYFKGNKHNGGQITLVVSQTASGSSYCTADVRVNQAAWGTATIRTATRRIGMTNKLTATPTDGTCSFLRWEDQYGNVLSTDNPYDFQQYLGNGPYYAIFDGPAVGGGNITYHLDGGTNHGSNPASYDGSADITLQNPTKANYTFMGWYTNSTLTTPASTPAIASGASGDYEFWAKWEINNYTVAASVSPVGAGSVSGTGSFAYGTDVTLTATPTNRRYQFVRWTESAVQKATTASYTIDDIDAAHTLVAEFEEIPVTLADNEESSYYSTTLSTFTGSMDFQLMRTFYAGMWNTVCFPFDLTASQIANSDMSDATFYTLSSVTGDAAEGLDFNVSEVTSLSARTPYLVQVSGANITNPVFEGVTLAASAFTNNTSGTNVGDTKFFGTVHPTSLVVGENSGFLFLGQNNQLYWPNVANDIRAFRAYFYSGNNTVQAVHPRVRLVVRPETPTDVIEGYNADTWSAVGLPVPARKVLDNGNLIIERDGIRYNAVGQKVN